MTEQTRQKVFTELEFHLWRIRYLPKRDWHSEIMVKGSTKALSTMRDAIKLMMEDFKSHGHSTRKFLCNPPEDIDVLRYANEHKAEIEWLIWLVFRMQSDVPDTARYELKNKAVTVFLNEQTASKLLEILETQLNTSTQYPHGQTAPGGLFFAPDWLGVE